MDFGSLLHVANKNIDKKAEVKYYSTKYAPPKKETKDKKLSSNIQKFLAKKEEEDKEKMKQAVQKREQLLASRDTKAKNKIQKMLKVIKSANKSVLDDAVDNGNTAFTLEGPDQPDEDDYGYVSQEASDLYTKLMAKYKNMPEEKKFSTGSRVLSKDEMRTTKDRVRAAIIKEQEEEHLPHRRQRQSAPSTATKTDTRLILAFNKTENKVPLTKDRLEDPSKVKPKVRKPPPPPAMDFQQLLKLAEQKQHEPIEIEVAQSKKDSDRLMTTKERRELEEKRAFFEAKDRRQGKGPTKTKGEPVIKQKMIPNGSIPKLNESQIKSSKKQLADSNGPRIQKTETNPIIQNKSGKIGPKDSDRRLPSTGSERSKSSDNGKFLKPAPPSAVGGTSKLYGALTSSTKVNGTNNTRTPIIKPGGKSSSSSSNVKQIKSFKPDNPKPAPLSKVVPSSIKLKQGPSSVVAKELPTKNIVNKRPSVLNVKETRKFPPSDIRQPKTFPPKDLQRRPNKRRILDDEDYDSEMDDFIDDGPEEGENYSKYISEIFGYDKNRYRDEDYDDRQMESTFAQQMREEFISKKIGIMEDLEDMRLEALEKQGKSQKKRKIND